MAAGAAELAPVARALTAVGAGVEHADDTTMLVVDVPANSDLSTVESILDAAVSMTCDFEIASDRHRTAAAGR